MKPAGFVDKGRSFDPWILTNNSVLVYLKFGKGNASFLEYIALY